MKILQVTGEYYDGLTGGIGKHVHDLAMLLRKKGHQVDLIFSTPKEVDGRYCKTIPFRKVLIWSSIKWGWQAASKAHELYKETKYDVVHTHMPTAMTYPLFHRIPVPLITTFHSTGAHFRNPIKRNIEIYKDLLCAKKSDRIITVSKKIKEDFVTSIDESKVRYIPNGIFAPKHIHKKRDAQLHFLFVGRLEDIKGVQDAIPAFAQLPDIIFDIIGDGSYRKNLEARAKGCTNIKFHGFIEATKLSEYYAQADAFILPSYGEGLPIAVLEAMSYRLPILTTRIPAMLSLVRKDFGIHVECGDVKGIRDAVFRLASDADLRRKMSAAAAGEAKKYYWRNVINSILSVYEEAMQNDL